MKKSPLVLHQFRKRAIECRTLAEQLNLVASLYESIIEKEEPSTPRKGDLARRQVRRPRRPRFRQAGS